MNNEINGKYHDKNVLLDQLQITSIFTIKVEKNLITGTASKIFWSAILQKEDKISKILFLTKH